jgi:hypothetical protein
VPGDQSCLAQNLSYPLSGSSSLKSAKSETRDELVRCDLDDYVMTVLVPTTRTQDIYSGGMLSVKKRTCVTWASSASSRVEDDQDGMVRVNIYQG